MRTFRAGGLVKGAGQGSEGEPSRVSQRRSAMAFRRGNAVRIGGLGVRFSWALLALLGVALAIRVTLILATPGFSPFSDASDYDRIAQSIAAGDGYPPTVYAAPGTASALRPPGWPLLLAAAFWVDHSYTIARLVSAFLGVAVVALVYLVGAGIFDRRTGTAAALLAALFPPLIMLNASLMSEALFVTLELAVVVTILAYRRSPNATALGMVGGALCGMAALTRSAGLLLPLAALVGIWTSGWPKRNRLLAAVALLATAALVIAPWTLRNARAFDAFVPISTQGGPTIAGTYNSESGQKGPTFAVWQVSVWLREFQPLLHGRLNEAQIDRELRSRSRHYAQMRPTYVAEVIALNTLRLLDLGPGHKRITEISYREIGIPPGLWRMTTVSLWFVTVLAAVGIATLYRRRRVRQPVPVFIWLVPALLYATVVWIQGQPRMLVPVLPFVVLLAAVGLLAILDRTWARGGATATDEPLAVAKL